MIDRPDGPAICRSIRTNGLTVLSGFGRPFGLGQNAEGRILVADMDVHGICRLPGDSSTFEWLTTDEGWSAPQPVEHGQAERQQKKWPTRRFNGPHSIIVAEDGTHYVVTYYSPGLHIFPATGTAGQVFGSGAASGDGSAAKNPRLIGPATGQPDGQGRILLTEYGAHSVALYGSKGDFIGAIGGGKTGFSPTLKHPAGTGPGQFDRPHMCRVLPDGHLVVADTWNHRLQRFTADGEWRGVLGDGKNGWRRQEVSFGESVRPGGFHAPVAIGVAEDSRFVVTDWGNNRLQWFDVDGNLLGIEDDLGLDRPYDAQVLGGRLFVANSHHGEVIVRDL